MSTNIHLIIEKKIHHSSNNAQRNEDFSLNASVGLFKMFRYSAYCFMCLHFTAISIFFLNTNYYKALQEG